MNINRPLKLTVISAFVIATFHVLAVIFYLYWFYWWFDIPLHLLGGLCVGFFSIWAFVSYAEDRYEINYTRLLLSALAGAFMVGVAWELFEYVQGIDFNSIGSYPLDTLKDMFMDLCGGYFSYLYLKITNFIQK